LLPHPFFFSVYKFEIYPFNAIFSDRHKVISFSVKCKPRDSDNAIRNLNNTQCNDNAPLWNICQSKHFVNELNNKSAMIRNYLEVGNTSVNEIVNNIEKIYKNCAKKSICVCIVCNELSELGFFMQTHNQVLSMKRPNLFDKRIQHIYK
jgi:hypothetical protein